PTATALVIGWASEVHAMPYPPTDGTQGQSSWFSAAPWKVWGNVPPSDIENQRDGNPEVDPALDEQYNNGAACDISELERSWAEHDDVPTKEVKRYKYLRNYAFAAYQLMETLAEEVGNDGYINTESVNIFESPSTVACHGFVAEDSEGENIYVSFRGSTPKAKVTFVYDAMGWTMAHSRAKNIYFLGHSLGGAIANLAAFDYSSVYKGKKILAHHLVTFGSPPVGNREFVKQYNSRLIPSTLVTSGFDLVPNFHLRGTYLHVKNEIYILPGGKRTIKCVYDDETFANDPACSPDQSLMNCSIADHSNYWGLTGYVPAPGISKSSNPKLKGKLVKQPTNAQLEVLESIGNTAELNDKTLESVLGDDEGGSDDDYYDAQDYGEFPEPNLDDDGITSIPYPDLIGQSDRTVLI
ncbi:hypothetical protein H4R33_005768, partial [Dimargaris cristalligena]